MSLAKKLQIKAGHRALALKKPKDLDLALPEGAALSTRGKGPFDVVLGFAKDAAQVAELFPKLRDAVAEGGVLWMAYPKKSSGVKTDLGRGQGWELLAAEGWAPVSQVAVDATWSALRFRHAPDLIAERKARGFTA
ncbi:MAG: hypothetical protein VYE22_39830 [Myxococcota bacterium]|nr:hypothetical protein [Myxococcota bacterium]